MSDAACIDCGKDGVKFVIGRSAKRPLCNQCQYRRHPPRHTAAPAARCVDCERGVEEGAIFPAISSRDPSRPLCNACQYRRHKGTHQATKLLRKYGLSQEDFQELLRRADNRCEGCGDPFDRTPNVDHCHRTGVVRGLLCTPCNRALGLLRDDEGRIASLLKYISR